MLKNKLKDQKFDDVIFFILIIFIIILAPIIVNSNNHLISNDFISYSSWYDSIIFLNHDSNFGYGYIYEYLALFFKEILGLNYIEFNILIIYFSIGLKIVCFSRLRCSSIILLTYLIVLYPKMELAALREAFSVSIALIIIFFWSSIASINKILLLIISLSLHYVTLIIFISVFIKNVLNKIRMNPLFFLLILIFCICASTFINNKDIFIYLDIPSKYLGYFDKDNAYLDVFSIPLIFGLIIILYIAKKCSKVIINYQNISLSFIMISILFLPVNFATGRFLNIGYLFSLLWVYQFEGKYRKIIITIFILLTLYMSINFYFDFPKYLLKIYNTMYL